MYTISLSIGNREIEKVKTYEIGNRERQTHAGRGNRDHRQRDTEYSEKEGGRCVRGWRGR